MSLRVRRKPNETWRECVARVGGAEGLQAECLDAFDWMIAQEHIDEGQAAWCALNEWDCLEYIEDEKEGT